jgi:alpha-L-fucosidase 2
MKPLMPGIAFLALPLSMALQCCLSPDTPAVPPDHDLVFDELARTWDEAIPLGNAILGNLVWEKDGRLRFSLDRSNLWDLRPMENINFDNWTFSDVYECWKADRYDRVQAAFDVPYNQLAAPSKIPAGALEFDVSALGKVRSVRLDLASATCLVEWENGSRLTTFIHGEKPVGWYRFEHVPESPSIELVPPAYNTRGDRRNVDQSMSDLDQLGYAPGEVLAGEHAITYDQRGWDDFSYQIHTSWAAGKHTLEGCWSISSRHPDRPGTPVASEVVSAEMAGGYRASFADHLKWWKAYWGRSAIEIPDPLLEKQYYLEMYKFGAAARRDAPPIALQSVWTADNGKLPPWKGDFHHDLNTQLSYWPSYVGNHLDLEAGFIDWLWEHRPAFRNYTASYFGVGGMNVPGVTTLEGEPMGGWIQYSMGPTVGAWLAHHFYLHWRYTMDREFLRQRAYPWLREVALYLEQLSVKTPEGKRKLPMSSSPEIYNNSTKAWFAEATNFDLALIRWTFEKSAELAHELGLDQEAGKWRGILAEWPDLAVDPVTGLMIAPGFPYNQSHRHFSHLMAFHPLGLLDISHGGDDRKIIMNTLENLERQGTSEWTGYSFSWQGNLYARAGQGEKAAAALRLFAECFCLKNSFHVNGDQCKAGHSNFTYRPFTLEGNFAFASGIQEMLLQSHEGVIRIFPAVPDGWQEARFERLRAVGAFLVSATMEGGRVGQVEIHSEKGGEASIRNPFGARDFASGKEYHSDGDILKIRMVPGETVRLTALEE